MTVYEISVTWFNMVEMPEIKLWGLRQTCAVRSRQVATC